MKPLGESPEVFAAYAEIDLCYYMLRELQAEMAAPRSGIERAIDQATGYGLAKRIEQCETAISLCEQLIENKKIVEADTTGDQALLDATRELHTQLLSYKTPTN